MFDKLEKMLARYTDLSRHLSDPSVIADQSKFRVFAKEQSELSEVVELYEKYKKNHQNILDDKVIVEDEDDPELRELAREELKELKEREEEFIDDLKLMLTPKDPRDSKNVIMEIRAGTGGEEAGLFAGDLFRMYQRYAELNGWKIDVLNSHHQGIGGFKEIIFSIDGKNVYKKLKFESGVHRVQRVPLTEASGRIHTSAASVAVLPEADDVDIEIHPNELRVDVYRSSGPGGQSVNTTDSAVRITHIPTGMVVTCQDEKSQHKNKAKALQVLRARLLEKHREEEEAKISESRRSMVGTGDRSAKIRTFNFPQNRVTDHRINLTLYKLDRILQGELDELVEKIHLADTAAKVGVVKAA
ncbi:peptide chain release factor 1 [candidate division KSB1 bacterium]|nr:peptide chain release factor 1 [candidate division KSB1 bacterium]